MTGSRAGIFYSRTRPRRFLENYGSLKIFVVLITIILRLLVVQPVITPYRHETSISLVPNKGVCRFLTATATYCSFKHHLEPSFFRDHFCHFNFKQPPLFCTGVIFFCRTYVYISVPYWTFHFCQFFFLLLSYYWTYHFLLLFYSFSLQFNLVALQKSMKWGI